MGGVGVGEMQGNPDITSGIPEVALLIPEEWWPYISAILVLAIIISNISNAFSALFSFFGSVFKSIRKIWRKPPQPPVIEPSDERVRVLRAVWLRDRRPEIVAPRPSNRNGIPIVSLINMKGGVGKTTVAANLGAYFIDQGKRVLFIDFDYQGTLSLMAANADRRDRLNSNSYQLLYSRSEAPPQPHILNRNLGQTGLFAAHYLLFRDEMELFANWAADRAGFDIRYALSEHLGTDAFQDRWDIVLIDCGPRFTTSTINALCASTHVLVPTILDEASAQAVGYLSREVEDHRSELFPNLRLLGVVPTMVARDPKNRMEPTFSPEEKEQLEEVRDRVRQTWGSEALVLEHGRVPRRADISTAAERIAYFQGNNDAKRIFGRLGGIIEGKLADEGFAFEKQS